MQEENGIWPDGTVKKPENTVPNGNVSIHDYWDPIHETNDFANYEACMVYTEHMEDSVKKVRGLLEALGLEKKLR